MKKVTEVWFDGKLYGRYEDKTIEPKAEVWLNGKLHAIYTGQDAYDVETGKIKVPAGSFIRVVDY